MSEKVVKYDLGCLTEKATVLSGTNSSSINHPNHYGGDTTYEAIKVIEAWNAGFHVGNVIKYLSRAGKKDPKKELEDLRKALWYLKRYIKLIEEKNESHLS